MPQTSNAVQITRQSFRVRELAKLHNIAPTTIYGWIAAGMLPASKVGGVVLVSVEAWDGFLAKSRAAGQEAPG